MYSRLTEIGRYDQNQSIRARRAERNAISVIQFEQAMFDWRSRHLILVLTLNYKPAYRSMVTFDLIREHRDRLLNNRRCNELLQGINGYVWKIEDGPNSGGLHLHMTIFYDGRCNADIHYAQCIGDYWANVVTQGMGDYWNSNGDKHSRGHERYGELTGQIDRHDGVKRGALRYYMRDYVAKDDQHVSTRINPHERTFGTSQLPAK